MRRDGAVSPRLVTQSWSRVIPRYTTVLRDPFLFSRGVKGTIDVPGRRGHMSGSRPRMAYRKLESGEAVVNVSGPFEPRPVESRAGRLAVRTLHSFALWRSRRMSPARRERSRREQEIAAAILHGRSSSDD